jgi:hypothetical protein
MKQSPILNTISLIFASKTMNIELHSGQDNPLARLTLDFDEACVLRDALQNYKHELKGSPSERGQKLYKIAASIADELSDKIRLS